MALMVAFITMHAQWSNDPTNNNFIANTSADAGEIYLSTDPVSGDTYMQWTSMSSNGWSPTLQRLNFAGESQWGPEGIRISGQAFATWSQGIAMAATTDGGVVSCFSNEAGNSYVVRINADGSFPWGEAGVLLFNGQGGSRTEVMAGTDGGVWALATDLQNTFVQYVNADGTLNPMITISESGKNCTYGLMVPANNGVFVVYEKQTWAYTYYYSKEIWVRGYAADGTPISADTQLMSEQTLAGSYIHYVVPDGMGGGYAYMWHYGLGGSFNTHVFHFNANGATTITDLNGVPVHSSDPSNLYLDAYATVDPDSHDLLIVYRQTDAMTQSQCKIFMNRVTPTGEKPWGEGLLVLDNGNTSCGGLRIDAFEYGGGFSVIYHKGVGSGSISTVEAHGFDMDGNVLWNTTMCGNLYAKTGDDNSTGFHAGQNIVAWVNATSGGLYAQNIGQNGEMGTIEPPTPPEPCFPPENFDGAYFYNDLTQTFGVKLMWTATPEPALHYNLYREQIAKGTMEVIEVDGEATEYSDESVGIGDYTYRLTAVYETCESDYATTISGEDYLFITVTSINENILTEPIGDGNIYTLDGRCLGTTLPEGFKGIYIRDGVKYLKAD